MFRPAGVGEHLLKGTKYARNELTVNSIVALNAGIDCFWARHATWTRNAFCATGKGGGVDPSCSPKSSVGSTVPPPEEMTPNYKIAQNYIDDAKKLADSEFMQRRAERVKERMEHEDARWSEIHQKVVHLGERLDVLETKHTRACDKLSKMMDEQVAALKSGAPNPYPPNQDGPDAFQEQGLKCDKALADFLKLKKTAEDKAWGIIKKAIGSKEREFDAGEYAMRKVELKKDTSWPGLLSDEQKKAVEAVEKRLSGVLSTRFRERVDATIVKSIPPTEKQRAHFAGWRHGRQDQGIYLSVGSGPDTVIHELGHSLETNANLAAAAQGFLHLRVGKEECKPLSALIPLDQKSPYDAWEVGRDNDFSKAFGSHARYVGKHYKSDDTEITSMGLEALHLDPVFFARKDPQYFKFILGVLDGTWA